MRKRLTQFEFATLAETFVDKRSSPPLVDVASGSKQAKREDMDAGKQGSLL